jgi:hypothetical protein
VTARAVYEVRVQYPRRAHPYSKPCVSATEKVDTLEKTHYENKESEL